MNDIKLAMKITMAVLIGGWLLFKLYKFFKEVISEVIAEAAEEKTAAKEAHKEVALPADLAAIEPRWIFAVSLAAIFRATFTSEFSNADKEKRFPRHLYTFDANSSIADPAKLKSDWRVVDASSYEDVAEGLQYLLKEIDGNDLVEKNRAAWALSALSSMTIAAAECGYITMALAYQDLDFCGNAAMRIFGPSLGWEAFSQAHLAGDPNNGKMGRYLLGLHIKDLLSRGDSPWVRFPWNGYSTVQTPST